MAGLFSTGSVTAALRGLSLSTKRPFSTSPAVSRTAQLPPYIPPYPYGPNYIFKQANAGLYGGSVIQFGNKISKGRNKGKTRRSWKPNIRKEKLWSEALGRDLELKVQHRVLRTIRKVGGLDQYLLGEKPARIKELGIFGWRLRWMVLMTPKMRGRFSEERKALGLPELPENYDEWLQQQEKERQEKTLALAAETAAETAAPAETTENPLKTTT